MLVDRSWLGSRCAVAGWLWLMQAYVKALGELPADPEEGPYASLNFWLRAMPTNARVGDSCSCWNQVVVLIAAAAAWLRRPA